MQRLILFCKAAGKWGIGLMTGGIVSYTLAAYEHISGHSLTGTTWFVVACLLFVIGAFLAWNDEFEKAILAGNPEVCIVYEKAPGQVAPPVVVKNLRGGNAYRVQIRNIPNGDAVAVFEEISVLPEGQSEAKMIVQHPDGVSSLPFEAFLRMRRDESKGVAEAIEASLAERNCSVVVDYYNVSRMRFTAEFEIRYSYAFQGAHTYFVRRDFNPSK